MELSRRTNQGTRLLLLLSGFTEEDSTYAYWPEGDIP